mgnify:CR=1 FL=1
MDKAYVVDDFRTGTVTRVKKVISTAGGKGLNVARVIASLKQDVIVTGFVGGFTGAFLEQVLTKQEIPSQFTHVYGETRTCINIIDEVSNIHTELLEPGPYVSKKEVEEFFRLYTRLTRKSDVITLSGSVPRGISIDIYSRLINIAKEVGKKVILDTSGAYLLQGIKCSPTIVKPNKFEAEQLLGRKLNDISDIIAAAVEFLDMGSQVVAISLGAEGVLVASSLEKKAYFATPPKIEPVNTVGCGDAMVAGFAIGLHNKWSLDECIKYAVAVSASAALSSITGSIVVDKINSIKDNIIFERISF